jgi:hypothetical protein
MRFCKKEAVVVTVCEYLAADARSVANLNPRPLTLLVLRLHEIHTSRIVFHNNAHSDLRYCLKVKRIRR